jgi:hypothetical protein
MIVNDSIGSGPLPPFPQPGKRERCAVAHLDQVRLFAAAGELPPLVEAVGRDQAAAVLKRLAEGRRRRHGLGSSVDALEADLGVIRPKRYQPPVEHRDLAHALPIQPADGQEAGRRRVVTRSQVQLRLPRVRQVLEPVDLLPSQAMGETAAHGRFLARRT